MFTDIRENAKVKFKRLHETNITDMAKTLDIEVKPPRRCVLHTSRNNVPGSDPMTYWLRSIFIPYIDTMVSELSNTFSHFQNDAAMTLSIVPGHLSLLSEQTVQAIQRRFSE